MEVTERTRLAYPSDDARTDALTLYEAELIRRKGGKLNKAKDFAATQKLAVENPDAENIADRLDHRSDGWILAEAESIRANQRRLAEALSFAQTFNVTIQGITDG